MRNKIAWKLTLYFAAVLLIFALVVGGTFMHFFGKHTLDLKKKEMQVRATKIAEVLQDNMSRLQNRYGGIGSSRFIRYIDNITMENVWVVDENKNVKMHREDAGALPEQHGMMHGHKRMLMRQQEDIAEPASDFDYNALSPEIKRAVEQGFTGQNFVMEEINPGRAGGHGRRACQRCRRQSQSCGAAAFAGAGHARSCLGGDQDPDFIVRRGDGPGVCPEYAFFVEVYQTTQ